MKFSVVCSPGVGDLAIMHIVSHHLCLAGHDVITVTPHRFGQWLDGYQFQNELGTSDAIFLQHGNNAFSDEIRKKKSVFTFFGSHKEEKHGPLKPGFDFVSDLSRTMVDNVIACLKKLFNIDASPDNGFRPPPGLIHRKEAQRIAIHATSGNPFRNWPKEKFQQFAAWAKTQGLEPVFLPTFPSLENMISFIYESGYFLGNDSGPGHIASCIKIPNLIIGREKRHMQHWRPGWGCGSVITPSSWIPNWKGWRLRENHWSSFISAKSVINQFSHDVLRNK